MTGKLEREKRQMPYTSSGMVMVVDDDNFMLESVSALLRASGFSVRSYNDGGKALAGFRENPVDVVLADVNMPVVNGIKLLENIRSVDHETPVIFMTGNAEMDVALSAIKMKVLEFIVKPFNRECLVGAVERGVAFKRRRQREKSYMAALEGAVVRSTCDLVEALEVQKKMGREIVERLTAAVELRDESTGMHISRIGLYTNEIARLLGMPDEFVETITVASSMHDIGKIVIPDAVLFKPEPLSPAEFEIIKTHTVVGEQILQGSSHPLLQMASSIALSHHERWDGTGYPHGLRGETIPLVARIVMLADQYDALRSKRVYKPALDHHKAFAIIAEGDDRTRPEHFDPEVLRVFRENASCFDDIFAGHQSCGYEFGARERIAGI